MMAEKNNGHFKILLGDDRSEHALAAVALLEDLPFASGTDITVFRAFAPTQSTDVILMEEALNQTCNRLRKKGLHAKPELVLGFPTEKFLKYAEEQMPDLIIIGAKGLRATAGILVGGVAQQVVEYAPCPVLVVRTPYNGLRERYVGDRWLGRQPAGDAFPGQAAPASGRPTVGDARAPTAAHTHDDPGNDYGKRTDRLPRFRGSGRAEGKGGEGGAGTGGQHARGAAGNGQACRGHPEEGGCCHRDHGSCQRKKY